MSHDEFRLQVLIAAALADDAITRGESRLLIRAARDQGISPERLRELIQAPTPVESLELPKDLKRRHALYRGVIRMVWRDGRVSADEERHLIALSELLDVPYEPQSFAIEREDKARSKGRFGVFGAVFQLLFGLAAGAGVVNGLIDGEVTLRRKSGGEATFASDEPQFYVLLGFALLLSLAFLHFGSRDLRERWSRAR